MTRNRNIAAMLDEMALVKKASQAVVEAKGIGKAYEYPSWTFTQLLADANRVARGLQSLGIGPGKRIALMVRPSFDFISLTFAIFKAGATIVLIDPGMGRSNLLHCLESVAPDGFVAIPLVHIVRNVHRKRFGKARLNVVVGERWLGRSPTLGQVRRLASSAALTENMSDADEAAIIFTTGSTGPPKGVLYTHGTFNAQVDQIRSRYGIEPEGADLAGFPLFGLFNAAMGMATVIPDLDPTRPASVNPASYVAHIQDRRISQSFASPAVWNVVGKYCHDQKIKLPTMRRVLSAGAPVPPHVLRWMTDCIADDGEIYTPYGATEALPVASISASEVLSETAAQSALGRGTCVGKRFDNVDWRVIRISDDPISTIEDAEEIQQGEVGELIVRAPQVTRKYVTSESATRAAKIQDGASFWHRMGDVGYLDNCDRFWFCGRMKHRVETDERTMFTIPTEAIFNEHASIYRSALVGVGVRGSQQPVMICEPWPDRWPNRAAQPKLVAELAELAAANPVTQPISASQILLKKALPVDIRHNAKIFREQLVPWAVKQL